MDTTYVNRNNSNEETHRRANAALKAESESRHENRKTRIREIKGNSEVYQQRKPKFFERTLNQDEDDPVRCSTMDRQTLRDARFLTNRVGRPRLKWQTLTAQEYLQTTQEPRTPALRGEELDLDRGEHREEIKRLARELHR